jgi:hypothetical protein
LIEQAIFSFVSVLDAQWKAVAALSSASGRPGLVADWQQATWEALVEGALASEYPGIRLSIYGEGADVHGSSSRFSFPEDLPTHAVYCRVGDAGSTVDRLSGRAVDSASGEFFFDQFVHFDGAWYTDQPPFDHALVVANGVELVLPVSALRWFVRPHPPE